MDLEIPDVCGIDLQMEVRMRHWQSPLLLTECKSNSHPLGSTSVKLDMMRVENQLKLRHRAQSSSSHGRNPLPTRNRWPSEPAFSDMQES